jgi:hypothetical protein
MSGRGLYCGICGRHHFFTCVNCKMPDGELWTYWGDVLCRRCAPIIAESFNESGWPDLGEHDQAELDALGETGVNR